MDNAVSRNIVVSAVNIRKGGTLTVLKDCLSYLSTQEQYHVTALVHKRELCDFPGINYIEIPWSIKSWFLRLWCEYVTMHRISKSLPHTNLWFSLHDTTPRVKAQRQAVYCHTSFPFLKTRLQDWRMDPKIPLFAHLTRFAYKINAGRNYRMVVQTAWFREALSSLIGFPEDKIVVASPSVHAATIEDCSASQRIRLFLYPSTPDCHKNFETACRAAQLLEERLGKGRFSLVLTISGDENRYARWLYGRYKAVDSINFNGFMSRERLYNYYGKAACLVFPSRVETWGLPISEFLPTGKPMLLANERYAHETAAGARKAAFFPTMDANRLSKLMEAVILGDMSAFGSVPPVKAAAPEAEDWKALFDLLLKD